MRPRRTPSSNAVFHLEGGTEDNDLWCEAIEENGMPWITSVWELTPEERQAIADGANIELMLNVLRHPPVSLSTTTSELGAPKSD